MGHEQKIVPSQESGKPASDKRMDRNQAVANDWPIQSRGLHFYAERAVAKLPHVQEFSRLHPTLEWIDDYQSFRRDSLRKEKECVILARKRGTWLKPFQCYQEGDYQYYGLNLAEGCIFDCVYCYLQSHLNHGALSLFVDVQNLEKELRQLTKGKLWISTGLLTDSLVAEKYFPVVPQISRSIPDGSLLELRTKSDDVSSLSDDGIHRKKVVVAWSLNPDTVARRFEYRTASLPERLRAARDALALDYRVAFHFDPVFFFEGWERAYRELIEELNSFPPGRIAFLSVGLFRYMPDLASVIRRRFPFHPILTGEFFPASDGKHHYFHAIRKEMYRSFREWLKPWKEVTPVFWSMEPDPRMVENF